MALEGVKVGPLDPDSTSAFGSVAATHSARRLIRLHAQSHPLVLTRQLARKLDEHRTKGLDSEEVAAYLGGLKLENGDPVVPEGAEIVGATVRGDRDTEQVLTFTFRLPKSGRTGKWFAAYNADVLPQSYDAGSEYVRVHELRERGVVAFDEGAAQGEIYRRESAGLRRENAALRSQLETAAAAGVEVEPGDVPETEGDTRATDQIVAENEQLRRTNAEVLERVAQLEARLEASVGGQAHYESDVELENGSAADEPPLENYDDLNAHDLIKTVKAEDTDPATVEQVLAYEETHQNRRTVVAAANERLGRG